MPKASTFAAMLASQVVDSDAIPIITNAGDNKLLPISEARNAVGPGWSSTVNAYNEIGATDEIKIQAAIGRAISTGAARVFVPTSMLPYDCSLVTFDDSIQMVREGGSFDVYDVQAYGAAGNDGQDDTTGIQAAIDAMIAAEGGTVFFPLGTYAVTGLTCAGDNAIFLGAQTSTAGTARGTEIHNTSTTGAHGIHVTGPGGGNYRAWVTVENMTVIGEVGGGDGIRIVDGNHCFVDRVQIFNPGGHGIKVVGCISSKLQDCHVSGVPTGFDAYHLTEGVVSPINGCRIDNCWTANNSAAANGVHITDRTAGVHSTIQIVGGGFQSGGRGIYAMSCRALEITGVYFEANNIADIALGTSTSNSTDRGVSIIACSFSGSNLCPAAVYLEKAQNVFMAGNTTTGHTAAAFQNIYSINADNVVVIATYASETTLYDANALAYWHIFGDPPFTLNAALTINGALAVTSITQASWTAPSLLNSWVNDGSYEASGYYKGRDGTIWFKGVITGGTQADGTQLFVLPTGFRPAAFRVMLAASTSGVPQCILIRDNGSVELQGASPTTISLDGIHFRP